MLDIAYRQFWNRRRILPWVISALRLCTATVCSHPTVERCSGIFGRCAASYFSPPSSFSQLFLSREQYTNGTGVNGKKGK
jgi:hypothetical protein